jgi:hypothetical protein
MSMEVTLLNFKLYLTVALFQDSSPWPRYLIKKFLWNIFFFYKD